ncbi:MAG TPA: hypothetical protein VJU86_14590 [Pyrinomonadaceae bacterium]|nr:hypothetical protein [Pyrinomonadaceae bacterium]
MRIVLLITVIESALIAALMIWLRFRSMKTPVRVLANSAGSVLKSKTIRTDATRDARWGFINAWKVEPQSDDRMQAADAAGFRDAAPFGRPAATRRRHQELYKRWSQDRHD